MATAVEAKTGEAGERTLVFISDLHLATDPEMRDFFAQDELAALLDELTAHPEPVDLIIAGDFFDLLQLNGADREAAFRRALHLPEYATLFDRLRRFTAIPRHRTIYLVGNHDAEMGWNAPLRRYLLASGLVSEISLAYRHLYTDAQGNGCLVYCEHGNDYDGINTVGDYTNPAVTPLGAHIVTDLVNYLEPLGRHAPIDAPTSIADIDNIHPLGMIPWWFLSTYFYQQVRRLTKYVLIPAAILYTLFHLLPLFFLFERYGENLLVRGIYTLTDLQLLATLLITTFDGSLLLFLLIFLLVRYDFNRTRRRYGLQDPDDIFRRGARHYRRTCEALVSGAQRPAHWPAEEPWEGAELFVYGHTHEQALTQTTDAPGQVRAFANTGTWTRKVVRIRAHLRLPPVFVPVYELNYVTVRRAGAAIRVDLWDQPKALEYRLPWTEWLATLGRRRPRLQPGALAPHILDTAIIPFRPGVAAPLAEPAAPRQRQPAERAGD